VNTTAAAIVSVLVVAAGLYAAFRKTLSLSEHPRAAAARLLKPWLEGEPEAVNDYDGPDSLRLLEDLEAHMKAYGEAVADYYDTTTGDR
jgi:hypothetical protein